MYVPSNLIQRRFLNILKTAFLYSSVGMLHDQKGSVIIILVVEG